MKLKIIHTNDLHSNFENFSRAVSVIKTWKDDHTLLLDGGDFVDFKSIELRGTKGMAAIELLEYAGYSSLTIGNNEMFNGVDILEHMAINSSVPFISNNLLRNDKTKINGVLPSKIIEINGIRVFITGSSPDLDVFNEGLGVYMTSYKQAIQSEIQKNRDDYDICILLNHVGTMNDELLARELDGVDIILSAHDHQLYSKPKLVEGTIINSAGCYGEHVGILELKITNGNVELTGSEMIATESYSLDAKVEAIMNTNKEKAVENLSRPLYRLEHQLWHDVIEENPLTNLIADGLRDLMGADLGLINSGIVNAGIFGFVSEKKLIEICPSPLNPTSFDVKGKHLKEALIQSLDEQICLGDGRGPGFRGKFTGRLHVSGAVISHDGGTVKEILIEGQPIDEEKYYKVASSDYLQRGSGYPALAENKDAFYRPEEIRDVIRMYAEEKDFIKRACEKRWSETSPVSI
ncbi:bifunctional metallophosphatase/5'-nucleotidase [Sediminibacillus massiliensis]|uniref:bifunctional metallophosphatase/5'-nucleotidase n=1 Tax=Sediminibacillus massiliensis TaxID=1926277 RepID=UPI00098891F6|nr:5'-nucleotidase C-terminal domain-containing protein [Sediminibacillus massiliensis]